MQGWYEALKILVAAANDQNLSVRVDVTIASGRGTSCVVICGKIEAEGATLEEAFRAATEKAAEQVTRQVRVPPWRAFVQGTATTMAELDRVRSKFEALQLAALEIQKQTAAIETQGTTVVEPEALAKIVRVR